MNSNKPKVLIWDLGINLKNSGGPAGYLYNWKEYLSNHHNYDNIFFIKDIIGIENQSETLHQKYKKWLDVIYKIDFLNLWTRVNLIRKYRRLLKPIDGNSLKGIDLNEFDIIHFHVSFHLYNALNLLKGYKGRVLLTSHSPEPLARECVASLHGKSIIKEYLYHQYEKAELKAWDMADYMMFPVREAIEPYLESLKYADFLQKNKDKLRYCPTSILQKTVLPNRTLLFKKLGIPQNAFVITYIGRHTEIKGYNELIKLGNKVLPLLENVYFVIGGNCLPNQGLSHPRWIELGWIDYGSELIASSDLFILPNKQTYFDIVALEVLRSGTPIMMSLTGGNKYFTRLKQNKGIMFYEYGDITSQIDLIKKLLQKTPKEVDTMRQHNMQLFKNQFSMESFLERYELLIESL